jgi:hypothetical protein
VPWLQWRRRFDYAAMTDVSRSEPGRLPREPPPPVVAGSYASRRHPTRDLAESRCPSSREYPDAANSAAQNRRHAACAKRVAPAFRLRRDDGRLTQRAGPVAREPTPRAVDGSPAARRHPKRDLAESRCPSSRDHPDVADMREHPSSREYPVAANRAAQGRRHAACAKEWPRRFDFAAMTGVSRSEPGRLPGTRRQEP